MNRYISENKELMQEWDWEANANLDPAKLTYGSKKKVWWKCPKCGGKWQATVYSRTGKDKTGCPYCAGKKVLVGFNDLATTDPYLAKEWHPAKNGDLKPTDVTKGNHKKVWWNCSQCGHEWRTTIANRGWNHNGCPVCANRICVPGKNDLMTTNPELAKEWHPIKNGDLKPTDVVAGSGRKVWWKCSQCGHEWKTEVVSRGLGKHGCPKCSKIQGVKALIKFHVKRKGSLAENMPELAKEWHPTKNGDLTPYDITAGSNRKVWWKCPLGHEYQATIYNRKHSNCPICNLRKATSFPEQAIFYYIKKFWPNSLNKYKDFFNRCMEFDIYIPERKIAIEYDGVQWHKTDVQHKREIKKYEFCKKHKIHLIRVKEQREGSWDNTADKVYYIPVMDKRNFHALERIIYRLLTSMGGLVPSLEKINIEKDKNEILQYLSKMDNSLADVRPDVAAKWNYEKNGNLTPNMFSVSSNEVVWWKCPNCGKEWKTSIATMTVEIYGCPECSKNKKGKTITKFHVEQKGSLAEREPELVKEWHPTKNGDLIPANVTAGSGKKVWWLCSKCGYEWQATIENRGLNHQGCPACANKVCISGRNDLATTNPHLAKEWHPTKNGDLKPTDVVAGSGRKVWWKCSQCGHEWKTVVVSRGYGHCDCPECSKSKKGKALAKFHVEQKGSLAENMPELAKEWHSTKNNDLTPYDIAASSHKKAWWKCSECGYEWQAVVRERAKGFCKCPNCSEKPNAGQLKFDFMK